MGKMIHLGLRKRLNLDDTDNKYMHKPESVLEKWRRNIQLEYFQEPRRAEKTFYYSDFKEKKTVKTYVRNS